MRPAFAFVAALAAVLSPIVATAQTLDAQEVETFSKVTVVERAYILKTAENLLMPKLEALADDPENKKDGYVWASKVTAFWYASLSKDAENLHVPVLSDLYRDKSDLFVKRVRGEITAPDMETEEQEIEQHKAKFLESLLADAPKQSTMPIQQLTAAAELMANKTHGLSVLRASK